MYRMIWLLVGTEKESGAQHVYYVNMEFGALKKPPKIAWVPAQDGEPPEPHVEAKEETFWSFDDTEIIQDQMKRENFSKKSALIPN